MDRPQSNSGDPPVSDPLMASPPQQPLRAACRGLILLPQWDRIEHQLAVLRIEKPELSVGQPEHLCRVLSITSDAPLGPQHRHGLCAFAADVQQRPGSSRKDRGKAPPVLQQVLPRVLELAALLQDVELFPRVGDRYSPVLPFRDVDDERPVVLTKLQAAVVVANAFLCAWPDAPPRVPGNCAPINFAALFANWQAPQERAKLECVVDYFRQLCGVPNAALAARRITLSRRALPRARDDADRWGSQLSPEPLRELVVETEGSIEDADGELQVDFANRFIGGGVLSGGCVQEEIRFAIEPELLCACLVFAPMAPHEAIVVSGTQRYCNYAGYGFALRFGGPFARSASGADLAPKSAASRGGCWPRMLPRRLRTAQRAAAAPGADPGHDPREADPVHSLTCIDAVDYRSLGRHLQYSRAHFERELDKAYAGFGELPPEQGHPRCTTVATGNWGCGAFLGDKEFKALLQWMAASAAGKRLRYYTFGDREFGGRLGDVAARARERGVTVGAAWQWLLEYEAVLSAPEHCGGRDAKGPVPDAERRGLGPNGPHDGPSFFGFIDRKLKAMERSVA